jgi:hypothetical protein
MSMAQFSLGDNRNGKGSYSVNQFHFLVYVVIQVTV